MSIETDAGTYAEQYGPAFQSHILAVCARWPGFIMRYRSALDYQFFSSDVDRAIAKVLFTHVDAYGTLPHFTTLQEDAHEVTDEAEHETITDTIADLFEEDITDAKAVEAKAVQFGKTQAMANAVLEAAEKLDKGLKQEIIPLIQEASMVGEDLLDLGVEFADWETRQDWYLNPTENDARNIIPTGLPHLDYTLGGGHKRGNLGVVLAPPKRGKTTTLINFGFGAMMAPVPEGFERPGFNVAHLSLEMHQDDILKRYDDRLAGDQWIKTKTKNPEQYVAYLSEQLDGVPGNLYVKSYPTRSLTPTNIRSFLTLLMAQGFPVDLLIVDYADIMQPERRIGETRHEQAGIYEDLRTIAGEFDLACWTASQAGKGSLEKETVDIRDFAESFEKAAIVDTAIGFCQTDTERASLPQECRLYIAKHRNREDDRTVYATIRRDCCRIRTTKLTDPAKGDISMPWDDDDDDDDDGEEKTGPRKRRTTVVKAASTKQAARNLKAQMRKDKPAPKKRTWPQKKKKGNGPTKKRKMDRPSKNI